MSEKTLKGIAVGGGIAVGPAYVYRPAHFDIPERAVGATDVEMGQFKAAIEQAKLELSALKEKLERSGASEDAAIFDAHKMILDDPTLASGVKQRVEAGSTVEQAVQDATDEIADQFRAMEDELFAARAADMLDLGRRVVRILLGLPDESLSAISEPCIVVTSDLSPSDTASLDENLVLGFCTSQGGLTSHSAILARTLGIPAVVGLGEDQTALISNGTRLALDGVKGMVVVDASDQTISMYKSAQESLTTRQAAIDAEANEPAITRDGHRVEVAANVGEIESAQQAVELGAEGVGLLRTEFL
ncbi:MAG: phosphoenolpyruvate--protein phosphotransferase, partial [Chloroflexi bacterium]|nr:phosphoenolpyruvate--protein phosphotransferase [Chloroflexota bacterium]